jgi:lysozyme
MQTSAAGAAFIAALEGIVTRAYRDVAGVWTIGVGHTAAAGDPRPARGMTTTRDEALAILARDLARCEPRVAGALGDTVQPAFDGGVSFDFNTGAIDRASWVAAFHAGDRDGARSKLMLWTKAGGRTVAGLVTRRAAEARLILDNDYGAAEPLQSAAIAAETVKALQRDLDALGFYAGAVDGEDGAATRAAVAAYQKSHPDLVADGIAGPATRTSISRDFAARRAAGGAAGAVAATTAAGAALAHSSGHSWAIAAVAGGLVLIVAGILLARRYGDELKRAATPT